MRPKGGELIELIESEDSSEPERLIESEDSSEPERLIESEDSSESERPETLRVERPVYQRP